MSEQSLGDLSHNRIHQMLEALQADGFPVDLLHRLRLDTKYRKAFIAQAQIMDKDMVGLKLTVEWHEDFCDAMSIVKALKERSPYSDSVRHSYRLKDEILPMLLSGVKIWRRSSDFPQELYIMPLYRRMTRAEARDELVRRRLLWADAMDALSLATGFATSRDDMEGIYVPGAVFTGSDNNRDILSFGRNGNGDPMLSLVKDEEYLFDKDCRLLVKRRPAAFM